MCRAISRFLLVHTTTSHAVCSRAYIGSVLMIKVAFFGAMHIRTSCVLIKVAFVLSCNICLIIGPNEFLLLCVIKKIVCLGEITFCLAHAHKNFKVLLIMLPFCWHEQEFCVRRSFYFLLACTRTTYIVNLTAFFCWCE